MLLFGIRFEKIAEIESYAADRENIRIFINCVSICEYTYCVSFMCFWLYGDLNKKLTTCVS